MKIAFVDLGRHYGGVEIYLLSLIKEWKKRGNRYLILVRADSMLYYKLKKEGYSDEIISVDFNKKSISETKKRIREENIDLFHINGINSGVFVSLLRVPIKCVTTVHGNAAYDRVEKNIIIQKLFVWLENAVLGKSEKIISVSCAIKELLLERGISESKINVVYNGIKEIQYDLTEKKAEDVFKICFVGRLETVKGCEYLLQALSKIKDKNFICDLYGEGSLQEELEEMVEDLQISSNIVFKGFCDKIREVINEYHALVQPSLYEAFPLTTLEAMNARTLVICSDVGGMRESVTDGESGIRFQTGNIEQLAESIIWAMDHKEEVEKIEERAFVQFKEKYTEKVMFENTFRIYEEVCNEV